MREIINLQLGQCGNNLAHQFLQRIALQHAINPEGRYIGHNDLQQQRVNVYFHQIIDQTYSARNILVDLEPGTIDYIQGQKWGKLYNCDNLIVGLGSAGNNWGVGYYGKGSQLIEMFMDSVRKQAENCDHMQGFQMFHSLSGGTGSGFGSLALQRLFQEYQGRMFQNFSIFPSPNIQNNILQPYNSVFSLLALKQKVDMVHTLQNQSIQRVCSQRLKIAKPTFKNINEIVALAASDITSSIRFPGQLNSSLRKMAMNLVPFRNLKFLINSVAPLQNLNEHLPGTKQILRDLFDKKSFLGHSKKLQKNYLTASIIFRGNVCVQQIQNFLHRLHYQNFFKKWLSQFQYSLCNHPPPGRQITSTMISNNNCIKNTFQTMQDKFNQMFRRRAYVHWQVNQGVDEMQFLDMESKLADLIVDYSWHDDGWQQQLEGEPQ